MHKVPSELELSYDRVAREYARRFFHELDAKPRDRELLDHFAELVIPLGPACDVGCGPGEVAHYLQQQGVDACGVDLSAEMVAVARELSPEIPFYQGDMGSLPFANASLGGIAAFYSIVHVPRANIPSVLGEFARVLVPGGWVLITFHIGEEILHVEEFLGEVVSMDFLYFQPQEIIDFLMDAGFEVGDVVVRDPYPDVEYQSQRAYIFAKAPEIAK